MSTNVLGMFLSFLALNGPPLIPGQNELLPIGNKVRCMPAVCSSLKLGKIQFEGWVYKDTFHSVENAMHARLLRDWRFAAPAQLSSQKGRRRRSYKKRGEDMKSRLEDRKRITFKLTIFTKCVKNMKWEGKNVGFAKSWLYLQFEICDQLLGNFWVGCTKGFTTGSQEWHEDSEKKGFFSFLLYMTTVRWIRQVYA